MRYVLFALLCIAALTACSDLPWSPKIVCTPAKPDTLSLGGYIITSPDSGQVCKPK